MADFADCLYITGFGAGCFLVFNLCAVSGCRNDLGIGQRISLRAGAMRALAGIGSFALSGAGCRSGYLSLVPIVRTAGCSVSVIINAANRALSDFNLRKKVSLLLLGFPFAPGVGSKVFQINDIFVITT